MKNAILIFLITIVFANCKNIESQQNSNSNIERKSNSTRVVVFPPAENLLENLTRKQKLNLNESIPPKVREILDNVDKIYIYYNFDKETKEFRVLMFKTVPNAGAILSDASLKKQFLESFYYDVSSNEGGSMCFSPRHKITASYDNKTVEIDICYECHNFEGKSSEGNFSGSLPNKSKSSLLINKIIEKYGTELQ